MVIVDLAMLKFNLPMVIGNLQMVIVDFDLPLLIVDLPMVKVNLPMMIGNLPMVIVEMLSDESVRLDCAVVVDLWHVHVIAGIIKLVI